MGVVRADAGAEGTGGLAAVGGEFELMTLYLYARHAL